MAGRGGFVFFSRRDGAGFFFAETGRGGCFFFPRRDGAVVFFPRRDGVAFFFFSTGRDGAVFFFFSRAETGRLFLAVAFFWRDGAKSLHRPAKKGGLNRPASRPCKALLVSLWVQHTHKHIFLILFFFRYFYIFACLVLGVIAAVCSAVCGYIRRVRGERRLVSHEHIIAFPSGYRHTQLLKHFEVQYQVCDIISYETTLGSMYV